MIDRLILPTTVLTPEELNNTIDWGKTTQRGVDYAMLCQDKVRGLTSMIQGMFIERGRWLWKVRTYELWRYLGEDGTYTSFDEWAASPEQNLTPSSANLSAQIIDLCVVFFRIPAKQLYDLGEKKAMLLAPVFKKYRDEFEATHESNRLEWNDEDMAMWRCDRKDILALLEDAKTLSWSALSDRIALKVRGQETFFRGRLTVGDLKSAGTAQAILGMLGISDLPDSAILSLTLRGTPHE